jgi:uncharacterized membrane protein
VQKGKTKVVKTAARKGAKALFSPRSGGGALARKATVAALAKAGKRMFASGADVVRTAADRTVAAAATATSPASHGRPPIQVAVDAAVPVHVAWDEWMQLQWIPEGVDEIIDVRRGRKGELRGRLQRGGMRWSADVLDEREEHSFAWRSTRGSDCAGLITFHRLSDWLTRIELSLDVSPLGPRQAIALTTHVADRRTAAQLRRFKARLELISPDDYGDEDD